jgi:hypothetical protein|tara:strand:- start:390 stop:1541 length:1152 start_codon:yes stop_codon:yes gene_type:complete
MAKKETLTDDGKLEEVEMEEAKGKSKNKELGLPEIDDEEGRADSEPDGEDGTKKAADPKTKKSKASAKAEGKAKKEEDDEDYEDDEDEDDEEEVESKKSKKESKKSKKEGMPPWLDKDKKDDDEDDEDDDEEKESKKAKKEDIDVDVSEDVAALIDGEDLSEEFKTKAATIFEAAVKSKISKIRKQIRDESKTYLEIKTTDMQTEMTEKMDEYMNYVVKEWMEENKLAVEQGVRNEVTESFISGLKKLFEEHYIDVPTEKEDVFESLVQEVAELETKLDESTQKHMDTVKDLNEYKAKDSFRDIVEGMVDTDIEKMKELTEDVDYESDKQYKEKLNIIKNSYFKSEKKLEDNKDTAATNKEVTDGKGDGSMDSVMAAISNLKK